MKGWKWMEMKINCLNNLLFSVERSLQGDEVVVMLLERRFSWVLLPDFLFFLSITLWVLFFLYIYVSSILFQIRHTYRQLDTRNHLPLRSAIGVSVCSPHCIFCRGGCPLLLTHPSYDARIHHLLFWAFFHAQSSN